MTAAAIDGLGSRLGSEASVHRRGSRSWVSSSIWSRSDRRIKSFRRPARVAGSFAFEIQSRIVAGLSRSSAATSATVSHGSGSTSSGSEPDITKLP